MTPCDIYDVIVLGGGSAGHAAAAEAVALGLETALIDASEKLGGLCILHGCMPSKTLIETANRMRDIRHAEEFGIRTAMPALDAERLQERRRKWVEDFRHYREREMTSAGYQLIRGKASFIDPHHIEVETGGEIFRCGAGAFIIATGSRAFVPEIPGLTDTPYWTSKEALEFETLPDSIAIIGAGPLAMEFAHAFEGFGSQVHLIYRKPHILSAFDPKAAEVIERASAARGIVLHPSMDVTAVSHDDDGFQLQLAAHTLRCDALLLATGRRPATDSLNLAKAGVATDQGRILSDRHAMTSTPHIFAAGDCTSPTAVVHLAVLQGQVAARNAALAIHGKSTGEKSSWFPRFAMEGVFTHPQVIRLGLTEAQAADRGFETISASMPFDENGKAQIAGCAAGFVELIADRASGELLGGLAVGPGVIETSHEVMTAICAKMTAADFAAVPHFHPTLAELWADAAARLAKRHQSAR